MSTRILLAAALLAATAASHAQLKPPADPGAPARPSLTPAPAPAPAPATPAAPAVDPAQQARELAAATAATEWLKLVDAGQYGKSWDETASIFRQKVPREQWVEGLPKNRAEYGKFNSRRVDATQYRRSMPNAPDGEYVAVRFISDYEKNGAADEIVMMMFDGGAWRPIGYMLR
jgi:opacity protein-like surface antigen